MSVSSRRTASLVVELHVVTDRDTVDQLALEKSPGDVVALTGSSGEIVDWWWIDDAQRLRPSDSLSSDSRHQTLVTIYENQVQLKARADRRLASLKVDMVNTPPHYTGHPSGIECIDVIEGMTCCPANAIKYIWRHLDKGKPIEDLKKARWYIDREIQRLEAQA